MYITDAQQAQSSELADLIQVAGDHLPFYIWQMEGAHGKDALEVGRKQIASSKELSKFSYQNTRVCIEQGQIIGASLSHKLPQQASLSNLHEHPEPVIPLLMLETKAPGAWYLHLVVVDENSRNLGVAKLMFKDALRLAREAGCDEIVLIVNSANRAALSLYGSLGFTSKDQIPAVPYPNCLNGSHWILLGLPLAIETVNKRKLS